MCGVFFFPPGIVFSLWRAIILLCWLIGMTGCCWSLNEIGRNKWTIVVTGWSFWIVR